MKTPEPDPMAWETSLALQQRISARIQQRADLALPFDDFMHLALYEPGLGYYAAGKRPFGHWAHDGSDFVTAPELSPLFARALARQMRPVLRASAPCVLELGAGSGRLAVDLLSALQDDCAEYCILEVSAALQALQRETVQRECPASLHKVRWLTALPEAWSGCVIGNEVLDALPVKLIEKTSIGWQERCVGLSSTGQWTWVLRDLSAPMPALPATLPIGYVSEICPAANALVRTLAQHLVQGAAIFFDYGFGWREYYHPQRSQGTLMCHYRHHAHDNPLVYVGLQDITAHVNFSAVAEAALEAGAEHAGYTTQARFLLNCGVTDELAQLPDNLRYRTMPAVHRLLSEAEMGELFKVWAFSRHLPDALIGFSVGDRSHTLD